MSIYCVLVIVLGAGTDVINESRIISSIQPFPEGSACFYAILSQMCGSIESVF